MRVRSKSATTTDARRSRGFTLIELIFVLAIVSIMAAVAYPRVNFVQYQADSAARLLSTTMQEAERLAITRQYDMIVSFDATTNRIRLVADGNNNHQVDPGERVVWKSFDDKIQFAAPPAALTAGASNAINGATLTTIDGMPSIIFRRDGAASSDLTVYLTSARALDADFRAVQVTQSTGRADWYRYASSVWKRGSL